MSKAFQPTVDVKEARRRLDAFRRGQTGERLFTHPTGRPAGPTGLCDWERSWWRGLAFWCKAILLGLTFNLPWNCLKVWVLRALGARVGKGVYFAITSWIDPNFPELLTIEDDVFLGMGAKVFNHECRPHEFRAGRVLIRRGAFIGGFAIIPCGVEIGEEAVVAGCSAVDRDVPAGATLIPAPARILRKREDDGNE